MKCTFKPLYDLCGNLIGFVDFCHSCDVCDCDDCEDCDYDL